MYHKTEVYHLLTSKCSCLLLAIKCSRLLWNKQSRFHSYSSACLTQPNWEPLKNPGTSSAYGERALLTNYRQKTGVQSVASCYCYLLGLCVAFTWGDTAPQGPADHTGEQTQIQFPNSVLGRMSLGAFPASAICKAKLSPSPQTKHLVLCVEPFFNICLLWGSHCPTWEREKNHSHCLCLRERKNLGKVITSSCGISESHLGNICAFPLTTKTALGSINSLLGILKE